MVKNISSKTRISKENIERSFHKLHRTEEYDQTMKTQPVIVNYESFLLRASLKKTVKIIKNSDNIIRITPSLTHHQLELLNLTQNYLQEDYYNKKDDIYPKFPFADVNGNLKLVLNQ